MMSADNKDIQGDLLTPPQEFPTRCTRLLEPNTVLTVEHGLYFIDMLLDKIKDKKEMNWKKIAQFKNMEVRIEDNIIKNEGHENITRDLLKD